MSNNLPQEVIMEILSRLPVESLIRFRCVSKSWYSLIASPHFISKHLRASQSLRKYLLLLRTIKEDCTEDYSIIRFDTGQFEEHKHHDFPFVSSLNYYRVIGSCHGLICLADDLYVCDEDDHHDELGDRHSCNGSLCLREESYRYASSIIIWNPVIKRYITLPRPSITYRPNHRLDTLVGFGFDSVAKDYKVLRIMKFSSQDDDDDEPKFEAELYSLKRGCWTNITSKFPRYSFKDREKQALAHGALHWIAYPNAAGSVISRFHIADETFDKIAIPECLLTVSAPLHRLSVHAYGESSIAVAHEDHNDPFACTIWAMNEYRATGSAWTKLCSIGKGKEIASMPRVFSMSHSGGLVWLQVHEEWISCYDHETGKIDHHLVGGGEDHHYNVVDSYVETLLLLGEADARRTGGATIRNSADAGASAADQRRESRSLCRLSSCLDFLQCIFCV